MKPEAISKDTVRSFLYFFFVLISLLLPVIHGGVYASTSSDYHNDLEVFPSNINALFENTQTAEDLTGVSISSNNPNPSLAKAGDDVSLIFTTSEDIENVVVVFQSGSSAVSGAVNVVENPTNTWTATYTVGASDTDGIVSFEITYDVVGGSAATPVTTGNGSVTVDTSPPSISSIITSWGSILNAAESNANDNNVIITTSENLGGQVVSVTLNGVTYTGSIASNSTTVPIPSSDLKSLAHGNSYTLTANVSDAAGNPADQFISPSFEVDTVLPQMSIFSGDVSNGGILNNTEISLTFSSTEQTYDFSDIDDIIVSGGSIDDFNPNSDDKTFTAMFSVSAAGDGTYTIDVNSGSFTDAAGNPNSEAPQFSWTSDTTPPTITITPNNASNFVSTSDGMATNVQAVSFILESDEQIANFLPQDIELSDGLSYLSGEDITELEAGRRYRIDLESTSQGSKSITIPINAFEDLATNQNNTSVQFSWTYDSSPPVVSSISAKNLENNAINNASTTNDQTIVLEFITSEPITGLIGDEIKVSPQGKGTFSTLQALQEDTYRISFNPTSDDTFTFFIDSNSFEDKVGNVNTDASSNFLWSYDNTAPIITVSPASQTLEKGGSFVNPTVTALDNGNDISSEIVVGGQTVDVDVPNTYTITYNVSDTAGNSATEQTHTVTVEDTIAPIITSSNEVSIDENIGTGQIIYTITANDPNSTFGIKGTDKDEFSVDPTTGELTLLANPDFETKSEYDDIIVTATDEFGNTRELPIIVTINDVDEISPEVSSAVTSTSTSIVIGFSEPIVNNNVTSSDFTISGAISNPTVSLITFSASSVTLSLTDPIAFDETVLISYVQTVGSIDDTSGNSLNDFVNQVVTNNLLDNEIPIITSPSSVAIDENIGSSQVVYTVNATDNDQISSYEITGGADASSFSIDPVSGEVRLLLDPNYENKTSYLFTVRASDPSNNLSNNFTVTVVINDLDEIPPTLVLNGDSFVTAEAGQPYTEPDPAYTVNDNNGEENVTVELQGVVNTNQIDSYDLVYTATDAAGNETTRTRTVQVADNTPPVITLTPYQETVYLNVNDSYTLPVLTIDDFDENPTIVIPDAPDTSKVDVTTLIWIATDNEGQTSSKTQTVIVGQPPTITLFGENPQKINLGTAFAEPGASAVDYLGADLSESLDISYSPDDTSTDTVRSFNAHYSVTDSNGVTTNVTRRFDVVDNIIPVLSFTNPTSTSLGSAITWPVKTTYIDPGGVEASDNYDDDATLVIDKIESVDTSTLNSENFVYFDTEDSSGNNATQLVRTVQMVDQTPPSVEFENPSQSEIRVVRKGVFTQPVIELSDNYDPSSDIILNAIIRNGNGNIVPVVDTYILDTYTITYSAVDTSGNTTAPEDQITTTIIIDPIVDASASSTVVCAGESVTLGSSDTDLQDANGNNYTIEWTSSPDIGVELGITPIVTALVTQTTTFTLTLIDSYGNTFPDSSTVQVNPLPSFTVQEDAEICEGSSINLGVGIADESAAGYAYRWESSNIGFISSNVNPSYTPISSDTVTLTVTSPAGCQESDSFEITVVEKPIITFPTGDVFDICEGDTFNITSSLFNVQNSENYSWSVTPQGTGTFEESETDPDIIIFTPNSSGIAAGQVLLTLTATDQTPCTGSKAESITLNIKPKATLSLTPQDPVVCSTEQIVVTIGGEIDDLESFTVSPNGAILNLTEREITYFPDESDGNSVEIILSADQVSPCEDEERIEAKTTIGITPKAEFQVSTSPLVVCYDDPTPINLSGTVTITDINTIAGFTWTVVDGGGNISGGESTNPNNNWLYYPGPDAISSGSAILQLAVIPNSPCPPSEVAPQTLVIELHQTPEITKKADNITFCEGDDIEITSDIIEYNNTSQSNFLWSTSLGVTQPGAFTAGTSSSAYSVYQPSQEDIDNGFVDLTITVTPNSSSACELPVSEVIRFNVNKTKIIELGDPVDVCESQGYFDLVNSIITDTNDPPNPYTPTSGVSWERADNGSVDGFDSSTSLTPRFTFSQSDIDNGQVIVKMTYDDGSCNTISDTKIINIIRTPFADLGAPINICVGDQTVLNNFIIRPVGAGNITWELLADSGATGLSLFGENSPTPTLNAEDTATGSYELKVTIDPVDGCGEQVVETVDVNVIEEPTVDLSLVDPVNFEVCQGNDFTFSIDDINILTEHAGGYTWSSFGDGSFDQPGNLTSIKKRPDYYRPGPNDIASGEVELILTLTPESPCTAEDSQSITIPISRNPVIQVPPSQEVDLCSKDGMVIQMSDYFSVANETEYSYAWSTSDNGIFQDPSSLIARYTPSPFEKNRGDVKLTLTATDSDCSSVDSKTVTFYFHDNPTISVGNDDEVILCDGDEYYQTDGYLPPNPRLQSGFSYAWSTDGDGYFDPSHTELKPKYIPGDQDRAKRKNDEGSTGVELKLTLVSTTACVVEVADSLQLFFEPKPTVSLPPDLDVCSSIPSIELSSTTANVDPSKYTWTREDGNGTFDGPTNETSTNTNPVYYFGDQDITNGSVKIKLTVKGNDGCSNTGVSDTQTITLIPPPTANVSSQPITICYPSNLTEEELAEWEGQELDIVGIFGENAAENYSRVEWTPVDSTKGEVTKNGNTLAPFFKPTISSGTTKLLLKAHPTNESTCSTDSPYCCEAAQSELTVNIVSEPVITFPSNQKICQGETFYLTSTDIDLGTITDYELLWTVSPSDEGELFNETSDFPYYIPLDDQVGDVVFNLAIRPLGDSETECTGSLIEKQFTLTIEPSTVVDAGPTEVALCLGETYTTSFANVQYSTSDTTKWEWTTDSSDAGSFRLDCNDPSTEKDTGLTVTYCPSQADYDRGFVNLTLTAPNKGVCLDNPDVTDTITLKFKPKPTVEIKGDDDGFSTFVCGDYTFSSGQVIIDNEDPSSLKWETNGDGTFIGGDGIAEPTYEPGLFDKQNGEVILKLTVTGADGCIQTEYDEIKLTIPTLDLSSSPDTVCINDTIDLEAIINPELTPDQYTISWEVQNVARGQIIENADKLKPTFKPLQSGKVIVIAEFVGNDFCSDSEPDPVEIEIDVVGLPEITSFPSDQEVCFDNTITLEAPAEVNQFADSILWTDYYFTLDNSPAVDNNGTPLGGTFANSTNPDFGIYTPSDKLNEFDEQVYVRLTMTAFASDSCDPLDKVSQSFTLTLNPAPSASMDPTGEVCADSFYQVLDATVDPNTASSYVWSKEGDGTLTGVDTLTPTYEPGPTDLINGEFTIELAVKGLLNPDGIPNCDDLILRKTVTIVQTPVVELRLDTADYCTSENPDLVDTDNHDNPILVEFQNLQNIQSINWSTTSEDGIITPTSDGSAIFYPSQEDYDNGQVTVTLTADPIAPCIGSVEDSLIITFKQAPVVDADITSENNILSPVCEDEPSASTQLNASALYYQSIQWTSSGTGSFDIDNILNPVYEFSAQDFDNGSVTLTITVEGDVNCSPKSDTVQIDLVKKPTVDIGNALIKCGEDLDEIIISDVVISGEYESLSWYTPGPGNLEDETTLNPKYLPNPGEHGEVNLYLTIYPKAPCSEPISIPNPKTIIISEPPSVDIGLDTIELCEENEEITLPDSSLGGAFAENHSKLLWTATGGSGLLTNEDTLTPTYKPSISDWNSHNDVILKLTVTGEDGCDSVVDEDTITLKLIPKPVANAGPDVVICATNTNTSLPNQITTRFATLESESYESFYWSVSSNATGVLVQDATDPAAATYTVGEGETGIITLTLTAVYEDDSNIPGGCVLTDEDTMNITINPAPIADIGLAELVCDDQSIELQGSALYHDGSVEWNAYVNKGGSKSPATGSFVSKNDLTTTFIPALLDFNYESIIIELTAFGLDGCLDHTVEEEITIPYVNAGDDDQICGLEPYTLLNAETNGTNYRWQIIDGNGTFSGQQTSTLLNPVYTPSQLDLDRGSVTLQLTVDPSGDCAGSDPISDEIEILITTPPSISVIDHSICQGIEIQNADGSFEIDPTEFAVTGAIPLNYDTILWEIYSGSGSIAEGTENNVVPTFIPEKTQSEEDTTVLKVTITGSNACGDQSPVIEYVNLFVKPAAELFAGENDSVCENQSEYTLSGATSDNAQNFYWTENGTGEIISGQNTLTPTYEFGTGEVGTVTFTLTADGTGACDNTLTRTFELTIIEQPTATIDPVPVVCSDQVVSLSSTALNYKSIEEDIGTGEPGYEGLFWTSSGSGTFSDSNILNPTYNPSENDILNGVTLYLRAEAIAPCGNDFTTSVDVTFSDAIVVKVMSGDPTPDGHYIDSMCAEEEFYSLDEAYTENADTWSWSTINGTGSFSNAEIQNPIYTPSDQDRNNPDPIELVLTAEGGENCLPKTSTLKLTINKLPEIITPSPSIYHCLNDEKPSNISVEGSFNISKYGIITTNSVDLTTVEWITNGDGSFVIGSDVLDPVYKPSPTDIQNGVTLTIRGYGENSCDSEFIEKEIEVTFSPKPEIKYIIDGQRVSEIEVCESSTASVYLDGTVLIDLDNIVWSTTNGTGSFNSKTATKPIYTPSEADFDLTSGVVLKANATESNYPGSCAVEELEIVLNLVKKPIINTDKTVLEFCESENEVKIGVDEEDEQNIFLSNVDQDGAEGFYEIKWVVSPEAHGTLTSPENKLIATYQPDEKDYEQGVILTLIAYGKGGCGFSVEETFQINFKRNLTIYPGDSGSICSGEDFPIEGATVDGYDEGSVFDFEWIAQFSSDINTPDDPTDTPNGIFIDNPQGNKLKPTYRPGTNDIGKTVYIFLKPENEPSSCYVNNKKITLDIGKEVSLYAGPDLSVCGDYGPVPIRASSNTSAGEPEPLVSWSVFSINGNPVGNQLGISDTSSLTTTYSPGSIEYINGISTVTLSLNAAGNFCPGNSSSDTMTITYYEPIDAYAGDPTSICGTDSPVLIDDAVILAGENSYESIEWRVISGYGPDPENNTTLKPTYQTQPLDANLPNRQVRIGLFIEPKQFDPVDQDGLILDYSCDEPAPFIKSIFISSAITGTGSIEGESVVCADNNVIAYSVGGDLDGVDQYQWSIPEGATYVNGTNENSAIINLLFNSFTENSSKTISVIASNGCGESRNLSKSINIKAQTQLTLDSGQDSDEQELCFGDPLDPIIYQIEGGAKNLGEALEIVWYIGANEITDSSLISLLPNLNQSSDKLTITGQFSDASIAGIYNYKIQYVHDEGDDCFVNDSLKTGTLSLRDVPTVDHDTGDLIQEVCEETVIDNIEFTFDTTITKELKISWAGGAPVGITITDLETSPFIIGGEPEVRLGEAMSTYAYTVTPIDSFGCEGESISGSLKVEASNSVIAISSTPPTICNGEPISYVYSFSDSIVEPFNINWQVFNEDDNLIGNYTSPPPGSGINEPVWNFTLNTITISGMPVSNIDANRTYSFQLMVPDNCDSQPQPITQKFKISAKPRINIYTSPLDLDGDGDPSNDPTSGQTVQTLCEGDNLKDIFVQLSGSNLFDPYLEGNPIGVSISASTTPGVWIISGSNLNAGGTNEYEYSVKIRNADQCEDTLEGFKINFDANHSIDLISQVSTESQDDLCSGSSLNPIIYRYSSASDPPIVTWRAREIDDDPTDPNSWEPLGENSNIFGVSVTKNTSESTISISGKPIADDYNGDNIVTQSVYEYTIVTSSSQVCSPDPTTSITESFSVTPTPSLSRSSQSPQTLRVCEGELIEIFFDVSSNTLAFELTQTPNFGSVFEIKTTSDPNKVKLTGVIDNITEELNLDYSLIAKDEVSNCSSQAVQGTIIVEDKHELSLIGGSNNQQICEGSAITPIVYEYSGGANSVSYSVLPPGLDIPEIDPIAKTITFKGTPSSQVSVDTEKIFTIQTSGFGSFCQKVVDTIKINLTPQPRFANLPQNYTVCEGDSVNFIELGLLDGADDVDVSWENNIIPPGTINWEVIDKETSSPKFRFTGVLSGVSEDKTYGFTLTARNLSTGCESIPRQGEINLQNGHELNLELGSKFQEICEGEEIEPIVYKWGGGATTVNVIGLPSGLDRDTDNENKRITISGAPTVSISQDEELKFTIKTANNSDSCTEKVDTLTIGLIKQPSIRVLTGSQFQTRICEGIAIDSVVFELFNGATKPFIKWENNIKPPGTINLYDNNDGTHTLKGEISGFDQDKTYNYSITAINLTKGCESTELEGSLGVQKGHELRRLSSYSSTQQKICEGQTMSSDIIYEFDGGASSAEVIGLPPGLDWNIDDTLNRLTISGTPVVDVNDVTEYDYKVISLGNDCIPIELEGKLTVEPDAEISLESPIATANQFICEGFPIEDITYTFGGGAIDVIYNGLPAGLTPVITNDPVDPNKVSKLTISGTPNVNVTEDTPFEYSIKALNNNGCVQPELKGTITIKANAELTLLSSSLSKDQIVCIGTDIIPVNIGYVNSEIPSVSGMPDGLYTTTDTANGILTIQGSVTELQLGNPNRKLTIIGTNTNGCRSQEIEIDIEVQPSYSIKPTRVVDDVSDTNNPSGASYVKNITCYDNNDGEIMVNLEVGGSSTNYIYSWTGPNNYVNTTQNNHIRNLSAGIYVVQVEAQGARDCSISQTYTITEPDPVNIITNEIRPVSCTGSEDGLISVTIDGGNENFYRNFIWEVLQEDVSCTTYTVRLRDNDNDGIFDIIDADIDNDGSIDPGKTDVNNDGMIDEANDPNYSFGTVSYQSCDGVFIQNNILRGEFSANGIYQVCAIPNTIAADAKLDHDLDPNTDNIASVTISGGSASCSAGTWTKIDRLKGSSLASNLIEGIYRLTVIEGPDLNDIESNDLESLRNDPDICVFEEIYELPKDQILYGSVRVDETYCSLSGGYIDIDVNQSAGEIYFYYDAVRVPNTDVEVIAAEFGINTYRVLIQNPNSNGSFEIRNATGCGVVVAQDLLDTNVLTPIINYTSPELEKYGTISERSNILFTLAGNTSYYRVEWDFGDASPVAVGERVSHQYFADGTYTVNVYVYNASGCFTAASEEIVVGKGYTILMPNAFSPNGDNINEIIGPSFTGLKAVEYYIYNSQGILVYQEFVSEDNLSPNDTIEIMGWDGENSDPSSNFYVYKIIGTRINEELVTRTGTIFLIE